MLFRPLHTPGLGSSPAAAAIPPSLPGLSAQPSPHERFTTLLTFGFLRLPGECNRTLWRLLSIEKLSHNKPCQATESILGNRLWGSVTVAGLPGPPAAVNRGVRRPAQHCRGHRGGRGLTARYPPGEVTPRAMLPRVVWVAGMPGLGNTGTASTRRLPVFRPRLTYWLPYGIVWQLPGPLNRKVASSDRISW